MVAFLGNRGVASCDGIWDKETFWAFIAEILGAVDVDVLAVGGGNLYRARYKDWVLCEKALEIDKERFCRSAGVS